MRLLDSITDSMDTNLSKLWEIVKDNKAWRVTVHGGHKDLDTTEQQQQCGFWWGINVALGKSCDGGFALR